MTSTREELESFHQFAADRLASADVEPSFDELLIEWQYARELDSVNEAIRRGLADIDAGRCRPAEQVMAEIRDKYGFTKR